MSKPVAESVLSPTQRRKYLGKLTGKARADRAEEIVFRREHRSNEPFETDVGQKTRRSSHAAVFERLYGRPARDVADAARLTGIPKKILDEVYARGLAAWQTGHRPGASQHAWGLARVYSFATGGPTAQGPDADLAAKVKNPIRVKGGEETQKYARLVAEAYKRAPDFDPAALPSYRALAASIDNSLRKVRSKVDVRFVAGQPYRLDDKHMASEVKRTGILYISTDFNEHPVFTPEENIKLRAIHDWFAHIGPSTGFSQRGELKAYNAQVKMIPRAAIPALFTEVVGQAMYATVFGEFPKQKIAILPGFDFINVGKGAAVDLGSVIATPELDPIGAL